MNWKISLRFTTVSAVVFFLMSNPVHGQTPQTSSAILARGVEAMGFDQEKTTHHFTLLPDGGMIEITANEPSDVTTRDAIRQHVAKIAGMFTEGNFGIPTLVHGQTPPGVDTMKRLKSTIFYAAENLPNGGRVQITTENLEARNAVHDFLRFQIREHETGDSLAEPVSARRKHPANNLGHDARPGPP